MTELEQYYNKFNEEKRLQSRHGQVEYHTTMHYIHRYLDILKNQRENVTKQDRRETDQCRHRLASGSHVPSHHRYRRRYRALQCGTGRGRIRCDCG